MIIVYPLCILSAKGVIINGNVVAVGFADLMEITDIALSFISVYYAVSVVNIRVSDKYCFSTVKRNGLRCKRAERRYRD